MEVDYALLSRLSIERQPAPDFGRLRQALMRQGVPDRLPLFKIRIADKVVSALPGDIVQNPGYVGRRALRSGGVSRADTERYVRQPVKIYYHPGCESVPLENYLHMLYEAQAA